MKSLTFLAVTLATLISSTYAGWGWGPCKPFQVQQDFDLAQYVGTWYQATHDKSFFQQYGKCAKLVYTFRPDGKTITVENTQFNPNTGKREGVTGIG